MVYELCSNNPKKNHHICHILMSPIQGGSDTCNGIFWWSIEMWLLGFEDSISALNYMSFRCGKVWLCWA